MFWKPFVPAHSIGGYYGGVQSDCPIHTSTNASDMGGLNTQRTPRLVIHHLEWCLFDGVVQRMGKREQRMRLNERSHAE